MSIDSNHSNPTVKQRTIMSVVAPYQRPSRLRSNWQLVNSILPYFGLLVAMYFSLAISYWLTLAIAVIAAGFLVRIFILFHDCCHRSLFKSRKANSVWGVITGIISFTPYQLWQRKHNIHHETSGDLDMR
ncbi:MAG: fatty acid desaturase, partial [Candidatus Zixiibacteriota bacterium]